MPTKYRKASELSIKGERAASGKQNSTRKCHRDPEALLELPCPSPPASNPAAGVITSLGTELCHTLWAETFASSLLCDSRGAFEKTIFPLLSFFVAELRLEYSCLKHGF